MGVAQGLVFKSSFSVVSTYQPIYYRYKDEYKVHTYQISSIFFVFQIWWIAILNKDYQIKTIGKSLRKGSIACKDCKCQSGNVFPQPLKPFELSVLDNKEKREKPILRYQGGEAFLYFVCSVVCLLWAPTLCPCTLCLATQWQLVRIQKPWPSGAPARNTGSVLKRQTCANSSHASSLRCKGKSCHTQIFFFFNQQLYWTDMCQPKVVIRQQD